MADVIVGDSCPAKISIFVLLAMKAIDRMPLTRTCECEFLFCSVPTSQTHRIPKAYICPDSSLQYIEFIIEIVYNGLDLRKL